jgi:hypothetical protein
VEPAPFAAKETRLGTTECPNDPREDP